MAEETEAEAATGKMISTKKITIGVVIGEEVVVAGDEVEVAKQDRQSMELVIKVQHIRRRQRLEQSKPLYKSKTSMGRR